MKIALAAAALLASPQVCAFQSAQGESVTVSYADLNLDSEAGRDRLLARVERAIDQVCQVDRHERRLQRIRETSECVEETTPNALAAINAVLAQ
jgi:UrcA family protein